MKTSSIIVGFRRLKQARIAKAVAVALWALNLWAVETSALNLAIDGKSDFTIVGNASDPAVQDLRIYLKKLCGADLPIVPLNVDPLPDHAIVVGERLVPGYSAPVLSAQGFHLKVLGTRIVIRSGSMLGTQFGVYGLLDDHFGCRWLTPEFESVPSQRTLSLPDTLDEIQEPSVRDREGHGLTYAFARRDQVGQDWRRRNRVGSLKKGGAYHNMYALMPPSKYFNDHPDWYPLTQAGVRLNNDPFQCMTWSNPGMIAELTRVILDIMSRTPEDTLVTVAQGDGYTPSYDPGDRALVKRYGAESASLIYCLNEVLKVTKQKFPNHCIVTFAYQGTHIAPINKPTGERLVPDPNLYLEWVRQGDSMRNINSGIVNTSDRDQFLEWTTLTSNLRVWSWSVGFQALISPFPNYRAMGEDIQWFAPRVKGFNHQSSSLKCGDWQEMRDWLWARLLWNKAHGVESLEQDFLKHYFGSGAAEPLWRYLSAAQRRAEQSSAVFNAVGGSDPGFVKRELYPPNTLDQALLEFEAALVAARTSGNPDFERHVRETRANSLAYLLYVPPQPMRRVEIQGQPWFLPNGDARFAQIGNDIADELRSRLLFEYSNPWFSREEFVARSGGPNAPIIENGSLRLEFNANLRGIICSLYHKPSGRELLSLGPPDKPSEGGIRDSIQSGVHEVRFQEIRENEATKVTSDAAVITNPYLETYPLVQRRAVTVPNSGSQIDVKTFLFTTSDLLNLAQWYPEPVYGFSTSEAIYQGQLLIRFNVWSPALLRVVFVTPGLVLAHEFSKQREFQLPAISQQDQEAMALCYVSNGSEHPVVVIEMPLSAWEQVRFNYEPDNQQLVLTGVTPKKAATIGRDVPMTRYKLRVITPAEAEAEAPVINLLATPGDKSIRLTWEAKAFPTLAGYKVYQGTELAGPFASVQAQPISSNTFTVSSLENGRRYFFSVTSVDQQGREGPRSGVISGVPAAGTPTTFLVAKNGAGGFLTIQEAFDALPRSSWQSDYTIEVLDTSAQFPLGYGGGKLSRTVIDASQGKRLNLLSRGGRAVIHGSIDLSFIEEVPGNRYTYRTTATIEGFRFLSTVNDVTEWTSPTAVMGPGPNSIVRNNRFENWSYGVRLSDYASNAGTVIERNLFNGGAWAAISDRGASSGGLADAPLIIRNNIFARFPRAFWFSNPKNTFLINNTFVNVDRHGVQMYPEPTFTVANNLFVTMPFVAYAIVWSPAEEIVAGSPRWDYNLFFEAIVARTKRGDQIVTHPTLADFQALFGKELHSLQTDPLLLKLDPVRDTRLERFQFEPNSPAIDAGTTTDIPYGDTDFFGNPRVTGGKIDIGAFEHPVPFGNRIAISSSNGSVTRSPNLPAYSPGTVVQLTPVADAGYRFVRWSGDVPAGHEADIPLAVIMDTRKNLTARFEFAVVPALPDLTVLEGNPLTINATQLHLDESNKTFRFRLGAGTPAGADINPVTGEFTWKPSEIQGPGIYPLTIQVEDNSAPPQTETKTFTITVAEANQPPALGLATTVTNRTFLEAIDIGPPGDLISPGTLRVNSDASIEVSASGSNIGGGDTKDHFHFAYQEIVGDFDVRVQIVSLRAVDEAYNIAIAALMMRETLDLDSRFVFIGVGPETGPYNFYHSTLRERTSAASEGVGNGFGPLNYPNVWVRLQRQANRISAFRSSDGQTWTRSFDLSRVGPYPKRVFVGLASCGRKNPYLDPRVLVEARYANFESVHQGPGPIPAQVVNEGDLLALKLMAIDRDLPEQKLTFSLAAGGPEGAKIDSATGLFSWTPSETQGGRAYPITVRVTDNAETPLSAEQTFTVTVNEVNSPPVLPVIENQFTTEGVPLTRNITATDADLPTNALNYALTSAPAGMRIDPATGLISWTPGEDAGGGSFTATVQVTDNGTPPLSASRTFTVTVAEVNSPPVLAAIPDAVIDELRELAFTGTATDPDLPANALIFSLDPGAPSDANVSPAGAFRWTPTEAQGPGTYPITVRVTDNGSPPLSDAKTFTITVNEVNQAPALAAISDKTASPGSALTFTVAATDADLPANLLSYSLEPGAPQGATIDAASGLFAWTPTTTQESTASRITVRVTDDGVPPLSETKSFNAVVSAQAAIQVHLSVALLPDGGVRLVWTVAPRNTYSLQRSADLSNWQDLTTITATAASLEYVDAGAPEAQSRFYRVVQR